MICGFKINNKKISITGHSQGATAAFNFACKYSNIISSAAIVSLQKYEAKVDLIGNITCPIRFYCEKEEGAAGRALVESIYKNNSNAEYILTDYKDHGSVTRVYQNNQYSALSWLVSNSR